MVAKRYRPEPKGRCQIRDSRQMGCPRRRGQGNAHEVEDSLAVVVRSGRRRTGCLQALAKAWRLSAGVGPATSWVIEEFGADFRLQGSRLRLLWRLSRSLPAALAIPPERIDRPHSGWLASIVADLPPPKPLRRSEGARGPLRSAVGQLLTPTGQPQQTARELATLLAPPPNAGSRSNLGETGPSRLRQRRQGKLALVWRATGHMSVCPWGGQQ